MMNTFRIALIAGAFSTVGLGASSNALHTILLEQSLYIHVYDQARVQAGVLKSATAETTRIFKAANIRLVWDYPPAESAEAWRIDMTASGTVDDRLFVVVQLRRAASEKFHPGALGFALPMAHTGVQVLIFYDRVEVLHRYVNVDLSIMLGHVIAHEIGHVVLASTDHSGAGLMQAKYTLPVWQFARKGLLNFRSEEARQMASRIARYSSADTRVDQVFPLRAKVAVDHTK